jgi:3-dehydroquinate dehydratase-2
VKIVVVHGPNLNLLGTRRPDIYGTQTLDEINRAIEAHAAKRGAIATIFQSNHEGEIIDYLHATCAPGVVDRHDAIIINPGAFTHYSIAIRDALEAVERPAIEVHLSDIHSREPFRAESVIAPVCRSQIAGRGLESYLLAIDALLADD